jgi:hypothetical protein
MSPPNPRSPPKTPHRPSPPPPDSPSASRVLRIGVKTRLAGGPFTCADLMRAIGNVLRRSAAEVDDDGLFGPCTTVRENGATYHTARTLVSVAPPLRRFMGSRANVAAFTRDSGMPCDAVLTATNDAAFVYFRVAAVCG